MPVVIRMISEPFVLSRFDDIIYVSAQIEVPIVVDVSDNRYVHLSSTRGSVFWEGDWDFIDKFLDRLPGVKDDEGTYDTTMVADIIYRPDRKIVELIHDDRVTIDILEWADVDDQKYYLKYMWGDDGSVVDDIVKAANSIAEAERRKNPSPTTRHKDLAKRLARGESR